RYRLAPAPIDPRIRPDCLRSDRKPLAAALPKCPMPAGPHLDILRSKVYLSPFLLAWGHPPAAKSLLRDVEFPEHVLVVRVVNIDLDPVQTDDAFLELLGELAVYSYVTG